MCVFITVQYCFPHLPQAKSLGKYYVGKHAPQAVKRGGGSQTFLSDDEIVLWKLRDTKASRPLSDGFIFSMLAHSSSGNARLCADLQK